MAQIDTRAPISNTDAIDEQTTLSRVPTPLWSWSLETALGRRLPQAPELDVTAEAAMLMPAMITDDLFTQLLDGQILV